MYQVGINKEIMYRKSSKMFGQNHKTFLVSRADDEIFYELDPQVTSYSM